MNPLFDAELRGQLDAWLKTDVITPVCSEWVHNVVISIKKNGRARFCVNYVPLNNQSYSDVYPLPRIDDNLTKLRGAKLFSAIDSTGAYHCVPLHPDSIPYTGFICKFSSFAFKRVPFGLKNAKAIYSRLVDMALDVAGVDRDTVLTYLDDTLVIALEPKQMLQNLQQVFRMMRLAGMKINPPKTSFFATKVNYLGHLVSSEGISMVPEYVEILLNWSVPESCAEVRSFLGKCGYYREYISHYSCITSALDKLKCAEYFVWEKQHQVAFDKLKDAFTDASGQGPRAYPNFSPDAQPFLLHRFFWDRS
jgi:hypothetical protein